ncbi:hypothetical protein N7537_000040 [Penicillium hordei]|jgi:Trans-aconitate methyltransferase|uniref:Methyltransferase domain-containing protein n=1 Tax=Penicillium hordei TaxID=40994 RepID=A0AAD6H4P3_9EURO|nr:uncharacterized protein N7537_000040 [Penicillium hordei]KAJ5614926.1 hypothetical protein N7537_000040 [Penicillium hordei]
MTRPDRYESIVHSYQDAYAKDPVVLKFINRALEYLPPKANILDSGCGTGNPVSMALSDAGHKVKGIDISPSMIAMSKENVPLGTFDVADMRTYRHPTEQPLDAIFNIRALFGKYREDIEGIIQNWGTWLQSNGLLCMVVLAADDYDPAKIVRSLDADGHAVTVTRKFMGKEGLNTLFSRAGWRNILAQNGFEIVDERMEIFVPPPEVDSDDAPQFCFIAQKL